MTNEKPIHELRAEYSRARLAELKEKLASLPELNAFPTLTVFGTGSYARLEASEYSDIDLFFVNAGKKRDIEEPRTKELQLFGKLIELIGALGFPKFSNDCEYLTIQHSLDITKNLGSPEDDHANYFTARMLLLLEGYCLYGQEVYDQITRDMISAYFRDYPKHRDTFQPVFLLNDVSRYWKTMLLNYENKRNDLTDGDISESAKVKQRVRNFKLKYSRMTTCFATIAALGTQAAPVAEEQVLTITRMTPRQRLEDIAARIPEVSAEVEAVLTGYNWFLEKTGLPVIELERHFSEGKRLEMFNRANEYGDAMFALLRALDDLRPQFRLLRYIVI